MELSLSYTADVMGVVDGGLAQRGRLLDNLDLIADFKQNRPIAFGRHWLLTTEPSLAAQLSS
ncbi:MAG: hypothetical protein ABL997_19375, partial [Planctomycetota bacterium]